MQKQQYKGHTRYYIPHHFVFYPIILTAFIIAVRQSLIEGASQGIWIFIAFLIFLIGSLSFMMRQHYALTNQNRIVRLEMRLRYYQLTQERFESLENKLSFKQVAALRFASDSELLPLIEKAVTENLSADAIKRLIKDWQPDYMRV